MRGVIWYQGESNQGRAEAYRRQLPTMVTEWRKAFQQEDLAFLAVQLLPLGKCENGRGVRLPKCGVHLPSRTITPSPSLRCFDGLWLAR